MGLIGLVTGLATLGAGVVFPAYCTINAIESKATEDDVQWLMYWMIFAVGFTFNVFSWPVLQWIPLYAQLRLVVVCWLALPQTKGAVFVYEGIIKPNVKRGLEELKARGIEIPSFKALQAKATDFMSTSAKAE